MTDKIRKELFSLQDLKYREMQEKIIPTVKPESIIGVRTPELRRMAKELAGREGMDAFLNDLPHAECLAALERFLPYVDNWATCDQMSPKVFRKHRTELLQPIKKWIASGETYIIRFGIGMLMEHYLDEDFDIAYPETVAKIRSEEYYVNMMTAWYFATALAKQYDAVLPFIENRRLDTWTHNKAIRKAIESYRITPEQKEYLKTLKIRSK